MKKMLAMVALCALGCGSPVDGGGDDRVTTIQGLTAKSADGASVYAENCSVCHLEDGKGDAEGGIGIDLVQLLIDEPNGDHDFIGTIIDGEGDMTPFGDVLSDQEIADVLAYVHSEFGS